MGGKHGAFFTDEVNGKRYSAFVDGIPDNCDHDYTGPDYLLFQPMENAPDDSPPEIWVKSTDFERELRQLYGDMDPVEAGNLLNEELQKHGWYHAGGAGSCSKCGKICGPDPFEFFEDE